MNLHRAIAAGDIHRDTWPVDRAQHINAYLGNGRMGGCFDVWGLQHNGCDGPLSSQSPTVLMHGEHWARFEPNGDVNLPLARLRWRDGEPPAPLAWSQHQHLHDGLLDTRVRWAEAGYRIRAVFDPARRDLLVVDIDHDGPLPPLLLAGERAAYRGWRREAPDVHADSRLAGLDPDGGVVSVTAAGAKGQVHLRVISTAGGITCDAGDGGIVLHVQGTSGSHCLLIACGPASREDELATLVRECDPQQARERACAAWRERWGGRVLSLPDPRWQALWARSLAHILASAGPDPILPLPCGWSGNLWPYPFPQDISFIAPALIRLGHGDIVRAWVDHFRRTQADIEDHTRRVWNLPGSMWAWHYPIAPGSRIFDREDLHSAVPPTTCQLHNAAYPARMAAAVARWSQDGAWLRDVAAPVILGSARFYAAALSRSATGTWEMRILPAMGQDEQKPPGSANYLDALTSAHATLQLALAMAPDLAVGDEEVAHWRRILADGIAYDVLSDPATGLCGLSEATPVSDLFATRGGVPGLNPCYAVDVEPIPQHTHATWHWRSRILKGYDTDHAYGWSQIARAVVAARRGDGAAVADELIRGIRCRIIDPDFHTFYEGSKPVEQYPRTGHFITAMGLFLQAVQEAVDAGGAALPPGWNGAQWVEE